MSIAISADWLALAVPLAPLLLAALCIMLFPRRPIGRLLPWAPLPALLVALMPSAAVEMPWLLLGAHWGLTGVGRVFLLFTSLLWIAAGIYAKGYMPRDVALNRFNVLWLLTLSGNLGLIVAGDIASFYTFYALMTFSAYGLVVHSGSDQALRAGRVYIVMAVLGEAMLLAGLVLAAGEAMEPRIALLPEAIAGSDHRNLITGLLLAGFGVKAGLPLLHMWLPLAHPVAPTSASAVLSGAMIKAGLLGWLVTLPLGELAMPGWGLAVVSAGLIGAFGGALVGVCQRQAKTVLAYSSISQMGLMTALLGAAFLEPELALTLISVIALYAFHHAFAKGALFLGVGVAQHAGGIPRPLLWAGLVIPGLALAGVPLTSGAAAKLQAKSAMALGESPVLAQLPLLFTLAAVGTTLLVARFLWCIHREWGEERSSPGALLGWLTAVLFSLVGVFWLLPMDLVTRLLGISDAGDLLWPVVVGALVAFFALRRLRLRVPIPAGDVLRLLTPFVRVGGGIQSLAAGAARDVARAAALGWGRVVAAMTALPGVFPGERAMGGLSALLFVVLLLALTGLLVFG